MTMRFIELVDKNLDTKAVCIKGKVYGNKELWDVLKKIEKEFGKEKVEKLGYEFREYDAGIICGLRDEIYKEYFNRNMNIFEYKYYNKAHKEEIREVAKSDGYRVLCSHILKQLKFSLTEKEFEELCSELKYLKNVKELGRKMCIDIKKTLEEISEKANEILSRRESLIDDRNVASRKDEEGLIGRWKGYGKYVVIDRVRHITNKYLFNIALIVRKEFARVLRERRRYIIKVERGKVVEIKYNLKRATHNILRYIYSYEWKFDKEVIKDAVIEYSKLLKGIEIDEEVKEAIIKYALPMKDLPKVDIEEGDWKYQYAFVWITHKNKLMIDYCSDDSVAIYDDIKKDYDLIKLLKKMQLYAL